LLKIFNGKAKLIRKFEIKKAAQNLQPDSKRIVKKNRKRVIADISVNGYELPPAARYQDYIDGLRLQLADLIRCLRDLSVDDVESFRLLTRKVKCEFWPSI